MGEEGDEGDEEFTTSVQADWVGGLLFEGFRAIVEGLDEFEHGASFGMNTMRSGCARV